jgi:hypothetical protein
VSVARACAPGQLLLGGANPEGALWTLEELRMFAEESAEVRIQKNPGPLPPRWVVLKFQMCCLERAVG